MITADLEDAELYVDGKFHGHAPATRKLAGGAHTILVESAGLADDTRKVEVPASSKLTRNATLQEAEAAP